MKVAVLFGLFLVTMATDLDDAKMLADKNTGIFN